MHRSIRATSLPTREADLHAAVAESAARVGRGAGDLRAAGRRVVGEVAVDDQLRTVSARHPPAQNKNPPQSSPLISSVELHEVDNAHRAPQIPRHPPPSAPSVVACGCRALDYASRHALTNSTVRSDRALSDTRGNHRRNPRSAHRSAHRSARRSAYRSTRRRTRLPACGRRHCAEA